MFEELTPPYATIVADPPWRYEQSRIVTTSKRPSTRPESANQYSTLSASEVAVLPVGALAAENAHLYLWTTNPILPDAFAVLKAWGFTYRTMLTWLKVGTLGMGYYWRGDTEHVLFATRGKAPIEPSKRERNWFQAVKAGHSKKPPSFFDIVERVSPSPRVELFARAPRLGWDSWGYGYESCEHRIVRETP